MSTWTKGQWPDAITTGQIGYTHIPAEHGMGEWYALRDSSHGIPTFGSVKGSDDGPEVRIFNYPGQTEEIAKQLVHRWNAHSKLLAVAEKARAFQDAVWDGSRNAELRNLGAICKADSDLDAALAAIKETEAP